MAIQRAGFDPNAIRALTFDVFGTVVDWRSSVSREVATVAGARGVHLDADAFADAWRGRYVPNMDRVRRGELPWTKLDALHRQALDELLERFGLGALAEADRAQLNEVWHRLMPWPDSVAALTQLRRRFVLATLSNGNVSLLADLARHAGLPFDCLFSAELCRHYKPDPQTYLMAIELLSLEPAAVLMVAAHNGDLRAAAVHGMSTAFVARPTEYGPNQTADLIAEAGVDVSARDLIELAELLQS